MAKHAGLSCYAITDHDTVLGIDSAIAAAKDADIICIPGVELSVNFHGKMNHLLGLGINHNSDELLYVLDRQMEARKKGCLLAVPVINDRLSHANKKLISRDLLSREPETTFSLPGLMRFLVEQGIVANTEEANPFVSGVLTYDFPLHITEAVEAIHRSGGIASLSHPLAPRISLKSIASGRREMATLLEELRSDGVDALEISSTAHSDDENLFLRETAGKEDFILTFGTDWHGTLSETGASIKNYLPYYDGDFSGIAVSDDEMRILSKSLNLK
jgi:predicted metal-dependent phosphoesterase TrpH